MKKFIFLLLIFSSLFCYSQNDTIVKFDYTSYAGEPVKQGWVMTNGAYKKIYYKIQLADTILVHQEEYMNKDSLHQIAIDTTKRYYENRISLKDTTIASQGETIVAINKSFDDCTANNEKLTRQFWTMGNISIHKKTFGISFGVGTIFGLVLGGFSR